MNKKSIATMIFSIACIQMVLVGCTNTKKLDQTGLTFGKLYKESKNIEDNFKVISTSTLQSYVDRGYNFALVVYEPYSDCTCWTTFQSTLRKYMKATNILFYGIHMSDLEASEEKFGLKLSSGNETVAIFRDGKVKAQKNSADSNDKFTSDIDTFSAWMEQNVHNSDMLFVTPEQLDGLFDGDSRFTLYIDRESCGDCSYLNSHYLKDWNAKDRNRSYVIDTDVEGIRLKDGKLDAEQWSAWKASMGMSASGNDEYGYGEGYTPSFYHYDPNLMVDGDRGSAIFDAAVYFNDTIEKTADGYVVADSFYSEERATNLAHLADESDNVLKGLKLDASDVNEIDTGNGMYYAWKNESAAKYHDKLLNLFLDFYTAFYTIA